MRPGRVLALVVVLGWLVLFGLVWGHSVVGFLVATCAIVAIGAREVRRADEREGVAGAAGAGASLVAIAYPGELDVLPNLLRAAGAPKKDIFVLAVDGEPGPGAQACLARDAGGMVRDGGRLRAVLATATAAGREPLTFLSATGPDSVLVALEVARKVGASDLFAANHDGDALDEDEERARRAWANMVGPKTTLVVHLVDAREPRARRRLTLSPVAGV